MFTRKKMERSSQQSRKPFRHNIALLQETIKILQLK